FLRDRGLLADLVVWAVKVVNVARNDLAFGILPGAGPDAVARVHRLAAGRDLGAQIGAPGLAAGDGRLYELLTGPVGPYIAAPVCCVSCWQGRSAHSRPQRSAPFPDPALFRKKVMVACCASTPALPANAITASEARVGAINRNFIGSLPFLLRSSSSRRTAP